MLHSQTLERFHDGIAPLGGKIAQHVVIVHHLPEAEAADYVVAVHVGHAEDGVEFIVGITQGTGPSDRGVPLTPALETRVGEGIVHLGRVEMQFHDSVAEDLNLALLVEDVVDVVLVGKRLQDGLARPGDPDVDVAALAAARRRVLPRQPRSLQDTAPQPQFPKNRFELQGMAFVPRIDLLYLSGEPVPLFDNLLRWHLLRWQAVRCIVENAYHGLVLGHVEQISPSLLRRILLEGGFTTHGDQEQFSEWMHYLLSSQPKGCFARGSAARG